MFVKIDVTQGCECMPCLFLECSTQLGEEVATQHHAASLRTSNMCSQLAVIDSSPLQTNGQSIPWHTWQTLPSCACLLITKEGELINSFATCCAALLELVMSQLAAPQPAPQHSATCPSTPEPRAPFTQSPCVQQYATVNPYIHWSGQWPLLAEFGGKREPTLLAAHVAPAIGRLACATAC